MKKVINGAVCDTETATKLGEASHLTPHDFTYWREVLYRTKSGRYFLYGEGGPASRYAEAIAQNEWQGGEKILRLSREAAEDWAEEHLTGDEYEAAFGLPDEVPRITIALTPENRAKLDEIRLRTGATFVDTINAAIERY